MLTLNGCNALESEIQIFTKLSDEFNLSECHLVNEAKNNTSSGSTNGLVVKYKVTNNTNEYYLLDPRMLNGIIALDMYSELKKINRVDIYKYLTLNDYENKVTYTSKELEVLSQTALKGQVFIDLSVNKFNSEISEFMTDTVFDLLSAGIKNLSRCGKIIDLKLIGIRFDSSDEYKQLVVLDYYEKRVNSETVYTYVFEPDSFKVLNFDVKSTGCESIW